QRHSNACVSRAHWGRWCRGATGTRRASGGATRRSASGGATRCATWRITAVLPQRRNYPSCRRSDLSEWHESQHNIHAFLAFRPCVVLGSLFPKHLDCLANRRVAKFNVRNNDAVELLVNQSCSTKLSLR